MELRAHRRRRALVQHLAKKRMPERIRQLWRNALVPGTRRGEPQLFADELLAHLSNRRDIALKNIRDGIDSEFDAAHSRCGEQSALFVPQLGDVMVDDPCQILRNRHIRESRLRIAVVTV